MRSLHNLLVAVISRAIISTCTSAFVPHSNTIGVHCSSRYPSTSVSLQRTNCNKRIGYPRSYRSIDCRSSSSTSLSASISTITTSISGFYKASPLLAGIVVGLVSRLTPYSSRSSRKDTKLSSLYNQNNTNFAIRVLCSGLVLGTLFELLIHGSIISSICK